MHKQRQIFDHVSVHVEGQREEAKENEGVKGFETIHMSWKVVGKNSFF